LEQAKTLFPHVYLLVGVCNDVDTNKYKGKTVMTEEERYEALRHCKWVDEVVKNAPWVVSPEFLEEHDIDYVAHDALPYADTTGQLDDVYGPVKRMGRFVETKRTEGVSTSDLILRIIRDYNEYVLRNLSRGYSRKDLGLSLLKEQRIRATASLRQIGIRMEQRRKEVEKNVQGFASLLESLVEKVSTGELGVELVENMDKLVTGFISSFERHYQGFEKAITKTLGRSLPPIIKTKEKRKRLGSNTKPKEKNGMIGVKSYKLKKTRV